MKKLITLLSLFLVFTSYGQFLDSTNYKGAFAPNQPMWTDGWCNWTPDSTAYPTTNITTTGNITKTQLGHLTTLTCYPVPYTLILELP